MARRRDGGRTGDGRRSSRSAAAVLVCAALAAAGCAGGQPAGRDVGAVADREIGRLEAVAAAVDRDALPPPLVARLDAQDEALAAVRAVASPPLRLYELAAPFVDVETIAFFARHRQAGETLEAFEALWSSLGGDFAAPPPAPAGSLAGALVETHATRAERLYRASRQYARIAGPANGLYYLAEADANRRFAALAAAAGPAEAGEPAADAAALREAAGALEAEARGLLAEDPTRQGLVPVSVRLEEAREMLDAGRLDGAALQLLETRLQLSRQSGTAADPPPGPSAPPADDDGGDDLAALLRAMGRDERDGERARIARAALLPLHASLRAARPAEPAVADRAVTLTLVRWPYT